MLTTAGATDVLAQSTGSTTTVGAASDYRAKGISKSLDDGTLSLATEWAPKGRLIYAGAGTATVDLAIGAHYETDVKIGIRPKAMGWLFDLALFYRTFPDASAGTDKDYVEARAQASRSWGPLGVRLLTWQTPDNFGPAGEANWSEAKFSWAFTPRIRASVAVGRHDQEASPTYSAWNAGAAVRLGPDADLDFRWYDTDAHHFGPRFEGEAVVAVTYAFGH